MLTLALVGAGVFSWVVGSRETGALATGFKPESRAARTDSSLNTSLVQARPAGDMKIARLIEAMRHTAEAGSLEEQEQPEAALKAALLDDDAQDLLRALPSELREHALAMNALDRWSSRDPRAALAWLAGLGKTSGAQIDIVVRNWLSRDFATLGSHLTTLPAGAWRNRILNAAAVGALSLDMPEAAVGWLAQMPVEEIDPDLLDNAVASWGKKDVVESARWAIEHTDSAVADRLLTQVVISQTRHNPAASIALAQDVFSPGEALDRATEGIALTWSETRPEQAAQWVASLPESQSRHHTLHQVLDAWAERDLTAAQAWVAALPIATQRDEWFSHLTMLAARENPATAIRLIEHISPGQVQESVGPGVVRQWARHDYEKAAAWVLRLPAGTFRQRALTALENVITEDPRDG